MRRGKKKSCVNSVYDDDISSDFDSGIISYATTSQFCFVCWMLMACKSIELNLGRSEFPFGEGHGRARKHNRESWWEFERLLGLCKRNNEGIRENCMK